MINYKYSEPDTIKKLIDYIDGTYTRHYAQTKYQATEVIIDMGFGKEFCLGNIIKYVSRYGKKAGNNKNDLYKIIHYAIIMLSCE